MHTCFTAHQAAAPSHQMHLLQPVCTQTPHCCTHQHLAACMHAPSHMGSTMQGHKGVEPSTGRTAIPHSADAPLAARQPSHGCVATLIGATVMDDAGTVPLHSTLGLLAGNNAGLQPWSSSCHMTLDYQAKQHVHGQDRLSGRHRGCSAVAAAGCCLTGLLCPSKEAAAAPGRIGTAVGPCSSSLPCQVLCMQYSKMHLHLLHSYMLRLHQHQKCKCYATLAPAPRCLHQVPLSPPPSSSPPSSPLLPLTPTPPPG